MKAIKTNTSRERERKRESKSEDRDLERYQEIYIERDIKRDRYIERESTRNVCKFCNALNAIILSYLILLPGRILYLFTYFC